MSYPDFEELLAEFNAERVRYLIGGAHAVALHARPRASKDIDIFVEPTRANAERAVSALTRFFGGTAPRYVSVDSLLDPHSILQLGVAPVRVDLLSHLATVQFREAWKRRKVARYGCVQASFVGLLDLIAEKTHWGRPQDLADLVVLRRVQARLKNPQPSKRKARVRAPVSRQLTAADPRRKSRPGWRT